MCLTTCTNWSLNINKKQFDKKPINFNHPPVVIVNYKTTNKKQFIKIKRAAANEHRQSKLITSIEFSPNFVNFG
jgi:hypothetical protein